MLSTAGAKVSKSDNEKMKRKLEDVFRQLQALEKDKNLSSRIRFVLRDIVVSFMLITGFGCHACQMQQTDFMK